MRTFKFGPAQADERFVNDSVDPASPRVAHDPVNDSGGTPAATTPSTRPNLRPPLRPRRTRIPRDSGSTSTMRSPGSANHIIRFRASTGRPSRRRRRMPCRRKDRCTTRERDQWPQDRQLPRRPRRRPRSMFPDPESRGRPLTQPTLDPLPEIREATQVGGPSATAHWSSIPVLSRRRPRSSCRPPAPEAGPMVVTGTAAFAAGRADSALTPPTPRPPTC